MLGRQDPLLAAIRSVSAQQTECTGWRKTLLIVGGSTAVGALLWYLFADDPPDKREVYRFQVTDPNGYSIGIRVAPDVRAARTRHILSNSTVFDVIEVVKGAGEQRYLRLEDGRGWAFTHSDRDGRVLVKQLFTVEVWVSVAWSPSTGFCISCMTNPGGEGGFMVDGDMNKTTLGALRLALAKRLSEDSEDSGCLPLWAVKMRIGPDAMEDIDLDSSALVADFARKMAVTVYAVQQEDHSSLSISCYTLGGDKLAELSRGVVHTWNLQQLKDRLALRMRAPASALILAFPDGRNEKDFSNASPLNEVFNLRCDWRGEA